MEGVGGSAGFADRTAYSISLKSHGVFLDVDAGKHLGVQTPVASPDLIWQYIEGIANHHPWYTGKSLGGGPVAPILINQHH
jgi:hypothetical protein